LEVYVSGYFDVSRRHSFDHTLAFNVPQLCQQALEQHARRRSRAEESPEQQAEKEYRHAEEICNQVCKDRRSIDDQISSLDRKAQQLRAELQLYEEAAENLRKEAIVWMNYMNKCKSKRALPRAVTSMRGSSQLCDAANLALHL
jgi:dsDNA-specific endonuclease/ATPase MutS2